jgi:hypothetical protein
MTRERLYGDVIPLITIAILLINLIVMVVRR